MGWALVWKHSPLYSFWVPYGKHRADLLWPDMCPHAIVFKDAVSQQGMVGYVCNLSTQEVEAEGEKIQGQPEFVRPRRKKKNVMHSPIWSL